ncbi:glycosyltransferase family 4 protein [Oscillatoria salina]|uniref:glycosyltransferase family 4 protein n=1 Tax=Oscillatoria salina TaxID=331517 RepID=UPI001CCD8606|nr:glycosyltransferase family 4 protein [Oscillatoria salina]MBZ8178490.1 glycosyltransferase [Oscillatoria salina IIICB1]
MSMQSHQENQSFKFGTFPNKYFRRDLEVLREKLKRKEHFAFNKAADGELAIVAGRHINRLHIGNGEFIYEPENPEDEELRAALSAALRCDREQYFLGVACPCCVGEDDARWMREFVNRDESYLTWANIFVNSNYSYYLTSIVPLYQEYEVILVCNQQANLEKLPFSVKKDFRCGLNAWKENRNLITEIKNYIDENEIKNHLFLFCCGPLGNILTHQLFLHSQENTYLDIGSTLDPLLFGEKGYTRGYLQGSANITKECRWNFEAEKPYDVVFVVPEVNRGWILDGICQEIAKFIEGNWRFVYYPTEDIPLAEVYYLAHYSLVGKCLKEYPYIRYSQLLTWYTHPKNTARLEERVVQALNNCTTTICASPQNVKFLIDNGVEKHKVTSILGGADPNLFQPHQREAGSVGFCTAYYPRKNPDLILCVVKAMPHRQFILLGRNWEKYEKFSELRDLPNFEYVEAPYSDYPQYYAQMDVFVSPAKLEGGPIPLIEAMMCNIVPVASKTGFAPNIITHGENGFLFNIDSSVEEVCDLIEQAYQIETNIRDTVIHLSWENFSLEVQKLFAKNSGFFQEKIQGLQEELKNIVQEVKDLKTDKLSLKNRNQELKIKLREVKDKNEELKADRTNLKNKIAALQAEFINFKNKLEDLQADRIKLKGKIDDLQTNRVSLKSKIEKLQQDKRTLQKEKKKLRSEIKLMQASKFWKVREKWVSLKKGLGLVDK